MSKLIFRVDNMSELNHDCVYRLYPFLEGLYKVGDVVSIELREMFLGFYTIREDNVIYMNDLTDAICLSCTGMKKDEMICKYILKYNLGTDKNPLFQLLFLQKVKC